MRSRAVPVLIPCANADQAAVSHVDRDKQLFSLLGRYGALPENHGVRINVVMDGGENIHRSKTHTFQDDVHHSFPIEHRKLLRQLHIVDVVVEQLALHIGEVFRNIQFMLLLQSRDSFLDLPEAPLSFELCDGLLDLMLSSTPESPAPFILIVVGYLRSEMPAPGVNDQEQSSVPGLVYLNKVVAAAQRADTVSRSVKIDLVGASKPS